MTYADLKKLIIPADFGSDSMNEEQASFQSIYEQLDTTVHVNWGATQFVIVFDNADKVAKLPFCGEWVYDEEDEYEAHFESYRNDYCALTEIIYNDAVERGLGNIFADTEYYGETVDGTAIYLQEKVDVYDFADERDTASEDSKRRVRELLFNHECYWRAFERDWLAAAIDYYGEDFLHRLFKFFEEHRLDDWHDGNYGWRKDGSPVLIDWAGFNEN